MSEAMTQAGPALPRADAFRRRLAGELVLPGDAGYDDARVVWNGMIDRYPALIVRCAGPADVAEAVGFAREHGLTLAVRGGGHNVSGSAVCDGGLVIDLSRLRAVDVDPQARVVRAQAGATIGDVDRATQAYGLAVSLGLVSETGIAGLTLGGGLSWMRRKHGLACDNLVSVEVVTAAGELVRADEHENPELFWGVRGGGGNFGVVTSFEFRAYPVGPEVFFALTFHPWVGAAAVLRAFREWQEDTPDEISSLAVLWRAPAIDEIPAEYHHQPVVAFGAAYIGDAATGEPALAPLRALGQPIADLSSAMPFPQLQQFFDEDYPAHVMRYYWTSLYLTGLPDDAIATLVELNLRAPSPHSTLDLWQLGGAMSRVGPADTAFGDRSAPFLLGIEANWEDPAGDDSNLAWARAARQAMEPFSTGAAYLNFPGFFEDGDRVRASFGANYQRLVALKNRYDPSNLFRLNQNIAPQPR